MAKKQDFLDFIIGRPLLSLLISLSLLLIGIMISDIPRMIASQGWPTTFGTITSHRFLGQKFKEYDGDFYTNIDVYIRYEYSVNGTAYSSLSVDSIDTLFYPQLYADRYPVGEGVTVYYNPKNPTEAVLEPGFVNLSEGIDIFSYLFFAVSIYFLYHGISGVKGKSKG